MKKKRKVTDNINRINCLINYLQFLKNTLENKPRNFKNTLLLDVFARNKNPMLLQIIQLTGKGYKVKDIAPIIKKKPSYIYEQMGNIRDIIINDISSTVLNNGLIELNNGWTQQYEGMTIKIPYHPISYRTLESQKAQTPKKIIKDFYMAHAAEIDYTLSVINTAYISLDKLIHDEVDTIFNIDYD